MKRFLLGTALVLFTVQPALAQGSTCWVTPAVVPMESTYRINVAGFGPSATYGVTIRQTGNGSYTKGIGSHPNSSVTTGPAGTGYVDLVAHGINTYDNPRLILNPSAGTVQVHVEPSASDPNGVGRAGCSFEVTA